MKRNLLITTLLLLATSAFSMPMSAPTDYYGAAEDQPTTVMAVYYEEGVGFAANAGVTIPLGSLWGFNVYEIPSFQGGDENIGVTVVELAFLTGIGKGWYIGPIISPVNIDWATDIETGTGNPVAYVKAGVGGIFGVTITEQIGLGVGAKYKMSYDNVPTHTPKKMWQGGLYLTVNF